MTSYIMRMTAIAAIMALSAATAHAASLENKDSTVHTITVTEDGVKSELAIGAGEVITFCADGCFVTMPNGDRAALSGAETVEIVEGAALIN